MAKRELYYEFMSLRSVGLSFDKISKKLGVSKQTLIEWNKKFFPIIEEATAEMEKQILAEICSKRTLFSIYITKKLEELYKSVLEHKIEDLSLKEKVSLIQQMENILAKITNIQTLKDYLFDQEIKDRNLYQVLSALQKMEVDYENKGAAEMVESWLKEYIGNFDLPKELFSLIQKKKNKPENNVTENNINKPK